jgi:hypothetical protein
MKLSLSVQHILDNITMKRSQTDDIGLAEKGKNIFTNPLLESKSVKMSIKKSNILNHTFGKENRNPSSIQSETTSSETNKVSKVSLEIFENKKKLFDEYSFYIYPIYLRLDDQLDRGKFAKVIIQHGGEVLLSMKEKPTKSKISLLYNPLATNNLEFMLKKYPNPLHIFDYDFDKIVLQQELKDSLFRKSKKI